MKWQTFGDGNAGGKMLYAIWTLFFIALDRLTKLWAERWLLGRHGGILEALPGVFRFHYAENTGVAFSMLPNGRLLIIALNLLLIAAVIGYLVVKKPKSRLVRLGLIMVAAGGAGNVIDRIALGYVIDFIEFTFVRFAVFNFADICVTVGAALAALGVMQEGGTRNGVDA
jgi:signal peptidase II